MNIYISKLLIIDQSIRDFINENYELSEEEFDSKFANEGYIDKAVNILNRLNRKNIIEAIKRCEYIWSFIDIADYLPKYPLDKKYLKENVDQYIVEYKTLQDFCNHVSDLANNYNEFSDYAKKLDIDGVEDYLLKHMPNEQLYKLSNQTTDWLQKLFYFSYFKKDRKKKLS
jgi:hypothetical protein